MGRGQEVSQRWIQTALSCRMDSFEDTLRQLREAFNTGRTRPAEFRAAQLQGLGRFLRDNKQQLQEALAQDLHKVAWTVGQGCVYPWVSKGGTPGTRNTAQPHLQGRGVESPWDPFHEPQLTAGPHPFPATTTVQLFMENLVCAWYWYQDRLWGHKESKAKSLVYRADLCSAWEDLVTI